MQPHSVKKFALCLKSSGEQLEAFAKTNCSVGELMKVLLVASSLHNLDGDRSRMKGNFANSAFNLRNAFVCDVGSVRI